jgi:hypothetical protein
MSVLVGHEMAKSLPASDLIGVTASDASLSLFLEVLCHIFLALCLPYSSCYIFTARFATRQQLLPISTWEDAQDNIVRA